MYLLVVVVVSPNGLSSSYCSPLTPGLRDGLRGRARSRARAFGRAANALRRRPEEAACEHGEGEAQKSHSERPEQVGEGPAAPGEAEMADRVLEQPGRELRNRRVLVFGQVRECRVEGEARRRVC